MPEGGRRDSTGRSREEAPTHRLTVPKPEDIGLPRAKRNYALPILIALAVFAVLILLRVLWG